jgi:hypothetical protein
MTCIDASDRKLRDAGKFKGKIEDSSDSFRAAASTHLSSPSGRPRHSLGLRGPVSFFEKVIGVFGITGRKSVLGIGMA